MKPTERERYDIIGDIHGHANPLRALLEKLGYREQPGHYRHPKRKAIFVGDFIDRGPQIREVLQIVRGMVDAGAALAVLGNHEWNALRYHSRWRNGKPMRAHSEKNTRQHQATLKQIALPYPSEWQEWLRWLRSLPLYLDLGGIRVVHAAWCSRAVAEVGGRRFADADFFHAASKSDSKENRIVKALLNGPELDLPTGQLFTDKEGHTHGDIRARWFGRPHGAGVTYRDVVFPPSNEPPLVEVPPHLLAGLGQYAESEPPIIFGHYWHPPAEPRPLAKNAACVDYSVASKRGGLLVAYRWDGERKILAGKFMWISSQPGAGAAGKNWPRGITKRTS